jgi:hypothetical protein
MKQGVDGMIVDALTYNVSPDMKRGPRKRKSEEFITSRCEKGVSRKESQPFLTM